MYKDWTSKDIPDLSGKVIIVTGGNIGLGFETVKMLSKKGADIILASRNIDKGESAKSEILKHHNAKIKVLPLDLASLASIEEFSSLVKANYNKLDVLLNNAGIMMCPYGKTKDGFELQFGTNHLGHFALTAHLMDLLKTTANSRVVIVSSRGHEYGNIDFNDLMWEERTYDAKSAYRQSKIANLYFAYELQRRLESSNLQIKSIAVHPGRANTNLVQNMGSRLVVKLIKLFLMPLMTQSAPKGALAGIRASVDDKLEGGEYIGPKMKNATKGYPEIMESNVLSQDLTIANKLWTVSEELTGVNFSM